MQFFYIIIYIIKPSRCALIFFLVCHSPTSTAAQSHLKIFRHATPHLCNSLPPSLSEFVILISQLHHTALHHHPLIHDYLLRCLMASSILDSKLTFSPSLYSSRSSSISHGLIPRNIDIRCLEVFSVWSTGECGRISQCCSWLLWAQRTVK